MNGLGIAEGFAIGIDKAVNNIVNLTLAKHKLQMQKESHDLDMKIKDLQLKKNKFLLSPEVLSLQLDKMKIENKAAKANYDLNLQRIEDAERKNQEVKTSKANS